MVKSLSEFTLVLASSSVPTPPLLVGLWTELVVRRTSEPRWTKSLTTIRGSMSVLSVVNLAVGYDETFDRTDQYGPDVQTHEQQRCFDDSHDGLGSHSFVK